MVLLVNYSLTFSYHCAYFFPPKYISLISKIKSYEKGRSALLIDPVKGAAPYPWDIISRVLFGSIPVVSIISSNRDSKCADI